MKISAFFMTLSPMPRSPAQALLLVDGYNVIGAWARLKEVRDRHGLEDARRELIEALIGYSSYQDYETQVVFDAQYQDTPGSRDVITPYVSVQYTDFRQTADSYIEMVCSRFRNEYRKFHQRLIVATSDRAQQQTVVGYGAEWMSALRLQSEVESAGKRVRVRQQSKGRSPGRFLASSLDPKAQEQLAKMRFGVDTPPPAAQK